MQVSVETTQGLERKLTVTVPSEAIDSKVEERLNSMKKSVKVNGFRPGKVPMSVIKKRYEGQVRGEVLGDVINSSFYEAVSQEKLRPAGYPQITPAEGESEAGFTFDAVFEVYPEITPAGVEGISIERPVAEVKDSDVDDMLETLKKQRGTWEDVDRASQNEDKVMIDFTGRVDGEEFEGGKAENTPLVLGSKSMIEGFEDQIAGMKAGDEKTIKVTFPEQYQAEHLAGKDAEFDIKVHGVQERKLPEIDEEFVKAFGIEDGNIESLRSDIRNNMQRELKQALDSEVKNQVMEGLLEVNEIDVPQALVKEETGRMKQQILQQMPQGGNADMLSDDLFAEDATRRVKLGLLIAEIVKQNEIKASEEKVREQIEAIAGSYQEPQQVIDYYYGIRELLQNMEGVVLEQQVCDWVLEKATVTDVDKEFKDVMDQARRS